MAKIFCSGNRPNDEALLELQLAPTILDRLGVSVPNTVKAKPSLAG